MGQEQSVEETREISPEQYGKELALRFAENCYSQLELYCFKQVFRSLADSESDIKYWSEPSLCRFLELPDTLGAGSVVFQMVTFLGAFPFPSQAPCIVTKEALIKVVTLMTERYERVLKHGRRDRLKLFYGSLAVFDRRASEKLEAGPSLEKPKDTSGEEAYEETLKGVSGYAIDEPANDDDEIHNDDDELALAALDALDDIEAITLSEKPNLQHSIIPTDNLLRLIQLLLLIAPLTREDNLSAYASTVSDKDWISLRETAANIMALFGTDEAPGVTFYTFKNIVPSTMSFMFDGFGPLFERFLFQKDFDLSKRRTSTSSTADHLARSPSMSSSVNSSIQLISRVPSGKISHTRSRTASLAQPPRPPLNTNGSHTRSPSSSSIHHPRRSMSISQTLEPFPSTISEEPQPYTYADVIPPSGDILTAARLSQLSFFIPPLKLINRLHFLYSGSHHGFSLNSFEKQVSSWNGASILLIRGTVMDLFSSHASQTPGPLSPGGINTPLSPSANPSERHFHHSLPPQRHDPSVSPGKPVTYGVYIPQQLKQTHKAPLSHSGTMLFQLSPVHDVFRASEISKNHATFCSAPTDIITGMSFGSSLPAANAGPGGAVVPLGAVSLFLDGALEYGVFTHSAAGGGSFYPSNAPARRDGRRRAAADAGTLKLETQKGLTGNWEDRFEVESVEVWGLGGEREIKGQRRTMEFEEREAKIRREGRGSVSGGAGVEVERELLKMAGLIGRYDERGGSMG